MMDKRLTYIGISIGIIYPEDERELSISFLDNEHVEMESKDRCTKRNTHAKGDSIERINSNKLRRDG